MGPISASYYVTTRCNARCGFCNIWEGPVTEKPRILPLADCTRILEGLRKLGVRFIDFTGGEALLEPSLPDLLRVSKSLGMTTGVVSNGFLYPKRCKELEGLVDYLSFSLDSAEADRHNASRGLKCYDRVLDSIRIARQMKQTVNLNFTATNDNLDELPGVAAFAKEHRILTHVMPAFSYFGNEAMSREQVAALRKLNRHPYLSVNLAALRLVEDGGNHMTRPVCRGLGANVAVSPDGFYYLPCFHAPVEKIQVAEDMVSQWHWPEMVAHRQMSGRYPVCEGCTVWCYLAPSFVYAPNRYFWLQAYSYAVTGMKLAWLRAGGGRKTSLVRLRQSADPATPVVSLAGREQPAPAAKGTRAGGDPGCTTLIDDSTMVENNVTTY